ncbi:MAG TPA: 2,3,4,5-tetrahydropyridine-2,6-dicarboxylate N-succinyltransferase [Gemmatimonadaceae bacterium]|nr:2,3,4,5-tetrahydropyridine-2,6-dicarboxylate N-succinyltransferase [Gemmatimonadaceae bacterium]
MIAHHASLKERIERALTSLDTMGPKERKIVDDLLIALERGEVRAAERGTDGVWRAVTWVKEGILLGFRVGRLVDMSPPENAERQNRGTGAGFRFFDKDTYPLRDLTVDDAIRVVPGGSSIRRGAYVARGVVCMPPMYINVGAHVGTGTMIDSHALVGSCAQVGERVHVSAAAQIGGVLEPVNASPVVIEDDVIVGGNCGVYEGTVVRQGAVIGAGVVLTRGTPVFDLVRETVYRGNADAPLEIPENAVVVPGARSVTSEWGRDEGVSLQTPVIVKYRDDKTDAATALESWLR